MEAERDESKRDYAQHDSSKGLVQQEHKGAPEALGLSRIMMDTSLDDEPTDD